MSRLAFNRRDLPLWMQSYMYEVVYPIYDALGGSYVSIISYRRVFVDVKILNRVNVIGTRIWKTGTFWAVRP